jgi:hypothetical protein
MKAAPSRRFRIESGSAQDEGDSLSPPRIEWLGTTEVTANQLVQAHTSGRPRQEATSFLQDFLYDGPKPANLVLEEAKRRGIAVATLNRAKEDLGVESKHRSWLESHGTELPEENDGGQWFWWIPSPPSEQT